MDVKLFLYNTLSLVHFHNNSSKNKDIFIFTTFRSGSTWLSEIFESQSNFKFNGSPPLAPGNVEYFNKKNSGYFNIEPSWQKINLLKEEEKALYEYLMQIKNDEIIFSRRYGNLFSSSHSFYTNRSVIRFLRCNSLIQWYYKNFDDNFIVLFRHPIATALSRLKIWKKNNKNKYWSYYIDEFLASEDYINKYLNDDLVNYIKKECYKNNDFIKFIISWCLEILPLIKFWDENQKDDKITLITYEELVMNSKKLIDLLSNKYNLLDKERMLEQIYKPSSTTKHSDNKTQKKLQSNNYQQEYLINKWKDEINEKQHKKVFQIINKFNINIYQYDQSYPSEKYMNFKKY
ncbi:MAG: sulfotransferase domain-containing protein [archaeon]